MFKRKGIIILFLLVVTAILIIGNLLNRAYVFPILMYHSVSPSPVKGNRLAVSVKSFERQMRFLKEHNYNVITLDEAADFIKRKKRIPRNSVAITLDDGYKDNYTSAFPIFKKYHLPATMFIIINEVGRPQNDRLSWDEIMEMRDSGIITFGSHTLGPEPLVNFKSEEEVKRQIFESKRVLEDKLHRSVNTFSYPEGRFNANIKQLVKDAGYKVAVITSPGRRFACDDVFALKRLRISVTSDNLFVFWFNLTGFYTFIKERRDKD